MNIEQLRDEGFTIKLANIAGVECVLVVGNIPVSWTPDNLIYRSSVWTLNDDIPVSLSYKKFFNWGEKPDLVPEPEDINNTSIISKIDGSALIISKFKKHLITRTRGTFSIEDSDFVNKSEIEEFKNKYSSLFNNSLLNSEEYSIICEWYSPKNIIVLNYGEIPKLFLTGIIKHNDYTYLPQKEVDQYALKWNIERPQYFNYTNISSMITSIKEFKNIEGVCVYYNNEQDIKKLKSIEYLTKHAFKSDMSLDNLIELYFKYGKPTYKDFYDNIMKDFDYECAQMCMGLCSKIIDGMKNVHKIIEHMKIFVEPLKTKNRKEAAGEIFKSYGGTSRSSFCFNILDGKELTNDQIKKLLFQVIH